nr:IST1-like protein [Ipomoea batatas]
MFDAWLKGKFYSKCKAGIKLTKTRVDLIRRKRNAMQKYLRNDIADLLKNGLDTNAYGRCEDLLVELNHSRCYDLMDQYCEQISSNLSIMSKQRECPEDCKEAVSTLMFAAARFGDVPELRYLRTIFAERYGNALDCFVYKEFVEKLKSLRPSKDMKVQLMQDIASEWGIDWNSKALEQQLYKPPAIEQDSFMNGNDQAYKLDEKAQKKGENHHLSNRDPGKESEVPAYHNPIPPPYTKSREEKMKGALGRDVHEQKGQEKDSDDKEAKPKPKSVRRIRNRALSDERLSSRDEDSNQRDEEMKKLDSLLDHYSRKNSAAGKPDTETKPSSEHEASSSRIPNRRSVDAAPSRSNSLPIETQQSSPTELPKGHARSVSYHAETCNPKGHVHPKLPDYDDLVALLAAARASMKE